jgi:hypothetical protein
MQSWLDRVAVTHTKGPSHLDFVLRPRGRVGPPSPTANLLWDSTRPVRRPNPTTRSIVEKQKDVGLVRRRKRKSRGTLHGRIDKIIITVTILL